MQKWLATVSVLVDLCTHTHTPTLGTLSLLHNIQFQIAQTGSYMGKTYSLICQALIFVITCCRLEGGLPSLPGINISFILV